MKHPIMGGKANLQQHLSPNVVAVPSSVLDPTLSCFLKVEQQIILSSQARSSFPSIIVGKKVFKTSVIQLLPPRLTQLTSYLVKSTGVRHSHDETESLLICDQHSSYSCSSSMHEEFQSLNMVLNTISANRCSFFFVERYLPILNFHDFPEYFLTIQAFSTLLSCLDFIHFTLMIQILGSSKISGGRGQENYSHSQQINIKLSRHSASSFVFSFFHLFHPPASPYIKAFPYSLEKTYRRKVCTAMKQPEMCSSPFWLTLLLDHMTQFASDSLSV